MSEGYRAGQGTISPALFIGAGGAGSRIVDQIARRASALSNWASQLRDLTNFVSIDTNELDQAQLRHVPEGNRLNISAFDKGAAVEQWRRSGEPQALQWLDQGYQPRSGVKPGAGQIRVESRLSFFYNSPRIHQRLQDIVNSTLRANNTWRKESPRKYNVYLFCTLAGGTGSGCFLSIAYLIDDLIRKQSWQPRLIGNLLLSTLLTDKVGPELHPNIHANTYAALKELEHLTKLGYKQVKDGGRSSEPFAYRRDENTREVQQVENPPFFLSFIHDRPPHLSLAHPEAVIADAAFLQTFTPVVDNLAGELDNYEQHLSDLTRFPGELRSVGMGYAKNYGAFGAVALAVPGEDLLEYCARRFTANAIRTQITFGVDRASASDPRTRALAKLAIDYNDGKFLNMADAGRERAISDSFRDSVREMARQDGEEELFDGYWYKLVESVDLGIRTGTDEKGDAIRAESRIDLLQRLLDEARARVMNSVSIKERAFAFHKESVGQYTSIVSKLEDDVRIGRQQVEEGAKGLRVSASEGELIAKLELDPIVERYLTVRLLEICQNEWIPAADEASKKADSSDINNTGVRERLKVELYESLQQAAQSGGVMQRLRRKDAFLDARDEANEYYRRVATGSRRKLDAELRLTQLRALLEYLQRRSQQYARLATRVDALVQDLERRAEDLRRGEESIVPSYALRVEAFETLDEPRRRIWDRVYQHLFVEGGAYLTTFDRKKLATTIARELQQQVQSDGRVREKTLDQTVLDLERALTELGREQMRSKILGGDGATGLDVARALELEARLTLASGQRTPDDISEDEIHAYEERKLRAVHQLAGVLCRVDTMEALDDGVVVNRTRQLITSREADDPFVRRARAVLERGYDVKGEQSPWHDPRTMIVHDVTTPIPLYYVEPATREIEEAYLRLTHDERRAFSLHTDFNWENSLPNLNPRRDELSVTWAVSILAEGLVSNAISFDHPGGHWTWSLSERTGPQQLGETLAAALYGIGKIHQNEDLKRGLDDRIASLKAAIPPAEESKRRVQLVSGMTDLLQEIALREGQGKLTREDTLDRPVMRVLISALQGAEPPAAGSEPSGRYGRL